MCASYQVPQHRLERGEAIRGLWRGGTLRSQPACLTHLPANPPTSPSPSHPTHSLPSPLQCNLPVRSIHAASFPSLEPPTRRDPGAPHTASRPSPPPQRQRLLQTSVCECTWTPPTTRLPTRGGTGLPLLHLSVRAQTHYAHTQTQAVQTHTHTHT